MTFCSAAAAIDGDEASSKLAPDSICRICLEETVARVLISPCGCRGTLAHVHRRCLNDMISVMKKTKCDICGVLFELQLRGLRPWREWRWPYQLSDWKTRLAIVSAAITWFCNLLLVVLISQVVGAGRVIGFIAWLLGPFSRLFCAILVFDVIYTTGLVYFATKLWIAENTVYEWKDHRTQQKENRHI
ncbi:zinc finger protein [Aphelenchoides avenae]|nr:zinc finger protein [Aphelenchus avenae]